MLCAKIEIVGNVNLLIETDPATLEYMDALEERVRALETELREVRSLVVRLQEELRKAANYEHEDTRTLVEGVQVFLKRAGEVRGRVQKRRRR
jgi:hypothetical protein